MQITAPFGYGEIVPLEKTHKVLLPNVGSGGGNATPEFCRTLNAMAISFSEGYFEDIEEARQLYLAAVASHTEGWCKKSS